MLKKIGSVFAMILFGTIILPVLGATACAVTIFVFNYLMKRWDLW